MMKSAESSILTNRRSETKCKQGMKSGCTNITMNRHLAGLRIHRSRSESAWVSTGVPSRDQVLVGTTFFTESTIKKLHLLVCTVVLLVALYLVSPTTPITSQAS